MLNLHPKLLRFFKMNLSNKPTMYKFASHPSLWGQLSHSVRVDWKFTAFLALLEKVEVTKEKPWVLSFNNQPTFPRGCKS